MKDPQGASLICVSVISGGDTVTITGTGFDLGTVDPVVTAGSHSLTVLSTTGTTVLAQFPPLTHGSYDLALLVPGVGVADEG